jgi:hypothetical protein
MASLRSWIYILVSLTLGLSIGVYSAQYAIRQGVATSITSVGPWQSFKETNISELNPYALAHTANHGNLKLANFEVLYFIARTDDKNRALSGRCEYTITGNSPDARWWSLTAYDQRGMLIENQADRYSFNNTNLRMKKDARFRIAVAANARPGNWIPIKADSPFMIMLRLYSPGIGSIRDEKQISFPQIERLDCS